MKPLVPSGSRLTTSGGGSFGGWEKQALNRPLKGEFDDFFKQPFRPSDPDVHRDDDMSGFMKQPFRPGPVSDPVTSPLPMPGKGLWEIGFPLGVGLLLEFLEAYDDTYGYGTRPTLSPAGDGWTRCTNPTLACESAWGPPDRQEIVAGSGSCIAIGSCPVNQSRTKSTLQAVGTAVATSVGRMWMDRLINFNLTPTAASVTIVSNWWRVVPGTIRGPYTRGGLPLPSLKPQPSELMPPVKKRDSDVRTRPLPYMPPYVEADPGRQPDVEISPKGDRGKPPPPYKPYHRDRPTPGSPDVEVKTKPKPAGGGRGDPPTHTRVPDGKKKIQMPPWLFALLKLYHTSTELMEAVDCIYDALPKAYNSGPVTGIDKVAIVFEHFEKVDWGKATVCIAYNQLIEDKIVGAFLRKLGKNLQDVGGPNITQVTQWGRQMRTW